MIKHTFELITKRGIIPVIAQPHIQPTIIEEVRKCKKFNDYIQRIDNAEEGVEVSKIELLSVEMFGKKVGFINLRAITSKDGFSLPSYIFLRGPSVGILIFVNGKLLLIEQYRVPVQQTKLEAPAGMLDESGDFVGTAALQMQQQTGIKITKDILIPLGSFYTSPGGSDEEVYLFYCDIKLQQSKVKEIQQKVHGKEGEKEKIKVKFFDYNPSIILSSKSSILIALAYAYQNHIQSKHKL